MSRANFEKDAARAPQNNNQAKSLDDSTTIAASRKTESVSARVLVVDDQPLVCSLQARLLEQMGFQVESAENGLDALQKLNAGGFDLLITDCEMPHMDGYQLAAAIRGGDLDYRGIPIIACTAHAIPEVADRCLGAGMNSVISKPMCVAELTKKLGQVLPALQNLPKVTTESLFFDEEQFRMLSGDNAELSKTLTESFLKDYHRSCGELTIAIESLDYERCRELAHRNKGACAVFGALELGAGFADLENLTQNRQATVSQLRVAMERIEHQGSRLTARFKSLYR